MSTAVAANALDPRWLPAEDLRAMGFETAGPEIDYGMRWGADRDTRVSFAPYADGDSGYLYAHDRTADRYLLLAGQTTRGQVDAAWRELTACDVSPDGYLALASLNDFEAPMQYDESRRLLLDCVDREMGAYRDFIAAPSDRAARFDLAYAVVVQRSARVAAEDLQIEAARTASRECEPLVIRYRVLGEAGWTGRAAGADLDGAASTVGEVLDIAARHRLDMQATSVSRGHARVAAARVPELAFVAGRPEVTVGVPSVGI